MVLDKIDEVASALGVMDYGMTDVTALSGGQRTRYLAKLPS